MSQSASPETGRRPRVGERLRELRAGRKLSQRQLAQLLGVANTTVSKWESGELRIDADELPRMAALLEADPCDFFVSGLGGGLRDQVRQARIRALQVGWSRLPESERAFIEDLLELRRQEQEADRGPAPGQP